MLPELTGLPHALCSLIITDKPWGSRAMNIFLIVSNLADWSVVLFLGFLLLGALRSLALVRRQVAQLEATMPGPPSGGRSV